MSGAAWDGPPERFRPPSAVVLLLPVVLSLVVQVPVAIGVVLWTRPGPLLAAALVALALLGPLALLGSRRFPGPTVALVSAAALADLLLPPDAGPPYLALAFAIVLVVARGALGWALASVGAAWLAAILIAPLVGIVWPPPRIAITTLVLAACFGIGWFARRRRERFAARREDLVQRRAADERRRREAAEAERLRVANELHDVLGHSLSLINVQAGVALHLLDRDPGHARTALEHIKAASGSALEEVRGVLGVLRSEPSETAPLAPQPGLDDVPRLIDGVRTAGLDVELDDRLTRGPSAAADSGPDDRGGDLSWAAQAAAYRIVQEALTNVMRHAGATRATVTLSREPGALRVEVLDDGRGPGESAANGGGGVLGMRSRAELLGGTLEIGTASPTGTRVTARLPWSGKP